MSENDEQKKILMEVCSISTGEIPDSYMEFGQLCWRLFSLGKMFIERSDENKPEIPSADEVFRIAGIKIK